MTTNLSWWVAVSVNILLLLVGQVAATLLNRYYYDQGGNSKWLETLTFSVAFPILYIPLLFFNTSVKNASMQQDCYRPPFLSLVLVYVGIGLITAADSLMYSYGLLYLSVSTYSLLCATQLAFNAVFSYFINSEKFTHLTLNSVVLLTFSAAVIGIRHESDSSTVDPRKAPLGFFLTLAASATYSLILSLMELSFDKVIKSRNFSSVLNMQIYTALVSTIAAFAGLFASGEWRSLKGEMESFEKGKLGYLMTVIWSSVAWQVTNVGLVGLIFEVSSLFSNVISTLGIPIVPVFAVILFGDKMDGMKVISLLLALWGFFSYFYQHYIDYKSQKKGRDVEGKDETSGA
ncbi:probable purine permease 11 isoform X2 [Asparagus officinalis]|nr:probable purine permease 11 isoform X2 [Asparagus officinalis]XP_020260781.1 probable purine permease 11 isoform X2 [Asparagus officinalis]XP_020260783.1 probable purine permease 11 isoform X2 [Asparagus officinalis]